MNRFVKQNLMLITVMGTACVVALALLVYAGILYIEMRQCIMESQSLKMSIVELSKSDPAPIDANRPLLQKDIDHYKKLNRMGAWYGILTGFFIALIPAVSKVITMFGVTNETVVSLAAKGPTYACAAMIASLIVCVVISNTTQKVCPANSEFFYTGTIEKE